MSAKQAGSVPQFDLKRQAEALHQPLLAAMERVLRSGSYILGAEVEELERELSAYLGVPHAIAVGSGTDALWLALKAIGVRPGSKVVTSPFTFFATASAILNAGAELVLVDIEPESFNLDPEKLGDALAGRSEVHRRVGLRPQDVSAVVPVHLYGLPADLAGIQRLAAPLGWNVIEDAAQAIGARVGGRAVGGLGDLGCFSFFPTKNLGALGDAGLVTTGDAPLAEQVRLLRAHGSRKKYHHEVVGSNSRLDALQAAVLRVKLGFLDGWVERRIAHARAYDQGLAELKGITRPAVPAGLRHAYHQYTIRVAGGERDRLQDFLQARGIGTTVYYPGPLHVQPALRHLPYRAGDFPESERAAREVLSLPIFPELTDDERNRVIDAIAEFPRGA